MPEMNRLARFFVNRSAARRGERRYRWIRTAASVPAEAECLEIGCGNGALAARFVDGLRPARYVASDLDARQLEEARRTLERKFPDGPPPALELRAADMTRLPFPDASFDVVLAFVAIHHASPSHRDFSRVPDALQEIDRVLRPNGLFLYAEIFHQEPIRRWLGDHGYTLSTVERRWRLESVVARKRGPTGADEGPGRPVARPR